MSRTDESPYLVHFTKDESLEKAYERFKKIIRERQINCGTGFIKNEECCVCFTEAPIDCLSGPNSIDKKYFQDRYSPFGFLFTKKYVHAKEGRHVIYSDEGDLETIPDELMWRYVRYEPNANPYPIDHTFEREWRLKKGKLILKPEHVTLIFPTSGWLSKFEDDHYEEQHMEHQECQCNRESMIIQYSMLFDRLQAEQIVESCPEPEQLPWKMTSLLDINSLDFQYD